MIRRMLLAFVMTTFALTSETSAQSQTPADTSKLDARVEALEKQVQLLRGQLASLYELQRGPVYKALKLTNVRVVGGPYSVGDNVTIAYALTNTSMKDLQIPVDRSESRPVNLVGRRQHWIERNGKDKTIPGILPNFARRGTKYAAGGGRISTRATTTMAAGDSLKFQQRLSTASYSVAGKYTYYIEYSKVRVGVIQTETLEFELSKK